MATQLDITGSTEQRLAQQLRREILQAITELALDPPAVAARLGVLPSAAKVLLTRETWPLEIAVRVADAIGIQVELQTRST